MKHRLIWGGLWLLVVLLASAPLWLTLPEPDALRIDRAWEVDRQGGVAEQHALPLVRDSRGDWGHYRLEFAIDDTSPRLYVLLPLYSQRAVISLAGHQVADTGNRVFTSGLNSGSTALVPLPDSLLDQGVNILDVHLQATGLTRGYLGPLYVGSEDVLAPAYRLRVFLLEYVRVMVLAWQCLMVLVVLVVWTYRPQEALFGWLALLLVSSIFVFLGLFSDLHPSLPEWIPYGAIIGSSASIVLVIISLLVSGVPPPRWLKWAVAIVPAVSLFLALTGLIPLRTIVLAVSAPLNIVALLASLLVVSWAAIRGTSREALLLLLPLFLFVLVLVHDFAIALKALDGPVFMGVYYRPALMVGIAMIFMRRLGVSLAHLDRANEHLARCLAEREAELARLHEEERREETRKVRSDERQRLTVDLHDGLSGHLASIIALAECGQNRDIEHSAREALDDLRLVIHSLDIEDRELTVALSGFHERLERQLKRLGIELDWSIARFPEISGVTPTQALNVLRILQEAVTNAIRHGRATHVLVRGDEAEAGRACLVVENNGQSFAPERGGSGLENMRRRVSQLGGEIRIEPLESGSRVTLFLPPELPAAG